VYWKWHRLSTGDEKYNDAVRFWAKIFDINFSVGAVTGIPMKFQFGTNRAGFARYAGGVIGQRLAMNQRSVIRINISKPLVSVIF
jgi:cytochrome d ubiquinol oxidase subunit I